MDWPTVGATDEVGGKYRECVGVGAARNDEDLDKEVDPSEDTGTPPNPP